MTHKKAIITTAAILAAFAATTTNAQAKTSWPAHCHGWKCVNNHLNALHQQALNARDGIRAADIRSTEAWNRTFDVEDEVRATNTFIANCLIGGILPVDQFSGYTGRSTALDVAAGGFPLLYVNDACLNSARMQAATS